MKFVNLITGQKRNLLKNIKSIENCQYNGENYNFFIFWDEDKLNVDEINIIKKKIKNCYFYSVSTKKYKKKINNILNKHLISKNIKKNLKNIFFQYFILQHGFNLASKQLGKKSTKYQWQRIRSDVLIENNYTSYFTKKILYLPGTVFSFGISDVHCIGPYDQFRIYSNLINTIKKLVNLNFYIPAEIALKIHLSKYEIDSVIHSKLPCLLLENNKKDLILKNWYYRVKGKKHENSNLTKYIEERNFLFKKKIFLRRVYFLMLDIIIRLKLKLLNKL